MIHPNNSSPYAPWSEQVVGVWHDLRPAVDSWSSASSLSVSYFNIYPFVDKCLSSTEGCDPDEDTAPYGHLTSGRSNVERNTMTDPSQPDPEGDAPRRALSTSTYQCPGFAEAPAMDQPLPLGSGPESGDTIEDLIGDLTGEGGACTLEEERFSHYDVERAGRCDDSSPDCLRESRLQSQRTVYWEDPGDPENPDPTWVKTSNESFDGVGHYRKTTTTSDWRNASPKPTDRVQFTNYNPGLGTLTLNPDQTIATASATPTTWVLGTYAEHWVKEGSTYRGGETCFDAASGALKFERSWRCKSASGYTCNEVPAGLSAVRTANDLVVKNAVNPFGEVEIRRYYGADTLPAGGTPISTTDNWCTSTSWAASGNQSYAVVDAYQFGELSKEHVDQDAVYTVDRQIDASTGRTITSTAPSGETSTFTYDPMGRISWVTGTDAASRSYTYTRPSGASGWALQETVYPEGGITSTTEDPQVARQYEADYDGLGRLVGETIPTATSSVHRTIKYYPGGQVKTVSSLDDTSKKSQYVWDYRGRLIEQIGPDGSKVLHGHSGIRAVRTQSCVHTDGLGATSGICKFSGDQQAFTTTVSDPYGRVLSVTSPEGFKTAYSYDPADKRTSALRTSDKTDPDLGVEISQARSWFYDGLGFLYKESIPERSDGSFSNFTTRGQARTTAVGTRISTSSFDVAGRLTKVRAQPATGAAFRDLKVFTYKSSGSGVGQLDTATRFNWRTADNSGTGSSGNWNVVSSFGYDALGRRDARTTTVRWNVDGGPVGSPTTFTQGWSYDSLGNLRAETYPVCTNGLWQCSDDQRLVKWTYKKGFYLGGMRIVTGVDGSGNDVTVDTLGADFTYHDSGLVAEVQHQVGGNDVYGVAGGVPRISSINLATGAAGARDLGAVSYDHSGNITAIGTDSFAYDLDSRLASATVRKNGAPNGQSFSYTYDDFDNIRNVGTVDPHTNQLTGTGWSYDAFGNLVFGAGNQMDYDDLDKLEALHRGSEPVHELSIYDHDDLRILRWDQGLAGAQVTWTLRDGMHVVRELVGLGSQILTSKDYFYAGDRLVSSRTYLDDDYAGSTRDSQFHLDQVGTVRLTTGTYCGLGVSCPQAENYGPFGEDLSDASADRTLGFQGHENDGLTTYMRARTYLPFAGRFLQVDPAGDGWNRYAFASLNPVGHVDPSGLLDKGLTSACSEGAQEDCVKQQRETDAAAVAAQIKKDLQQRQVPISVADGLQLPDSGPKISAAPRGDQSKPETESKQDHGDYWGGSVSVIVAQGGVYSDNYGRVFVTVGPGIGTAGYSGGGGSMSVLNPPEEGKSREQVVKDHLSGWSVDVSGGAFVNIGRSWSSAGAASEATIGTGLSAGAFVTYGFQVWPLPGFGGDDH